MHDLERVAFKTKRRNARQYFSPHFTKGPVFANFPYLGLESVLKYPPTFVHESPGKWKAVPP